METLIIQVNCKRNRDETPQLGITVDIPHSEVLGPRVQQLQPLTDYLDHDYQNLDIPSETTNQKTVPSYSATLRNNNNDIHHFNNNADIQTKYSTFSANPGQYMRGGLLITQIHKDSVIDRNGQFRVGDIIVEVNGIDLQKRTFKGAQRKLKEMVALQSSQWPLVLKVIRRKDSNSSLPSTNGSNTTVVENFSFNNDLFNDTSKTLDQSDTSSKKSPQRTSTESSIRSTAPRHLIGPLNTRRIGTKHCIRLAKNKDGGFGIKIAERDNMFGSNRPIYITAITTSGSAYRDGRLKEGDMLLEVNGMKLSGKTQPEVTRMLKNVGVNEVVEFIVSRQEDADTFPEPHPNSDDYINIEAGSTSTEDRSKTNGLNHQEKSLIDLSVPDGEVDAFDTVSNKKLEERIDNIFNLKNLDGPGVHVYDIPTNDTRSAGLGLYLKYPSISGKDLGIWIEKVITGGAAWKDGRLQPDDQILAVNGVELVNLSNEEASRTLETVVWQGIGPEARPNTIRLNIHRRDRQTVEKILHGADKLVEVETNPCSIAGVKNTEVASSNQSCDEESIELENGEDQFQRDGFGRQSISEKRHAQLMAKNTDTFKRNQRLREERERQKEIEEQLERQHLHDVDQSNFVKNSDIYPRTSNQSVVCPPGSNTGSPTIASRMANFLRPLLPKTKILHSSNTLTSAKELRREKKKSQLRSGHNKESDCPSSSFTQAATISRTNGMQNVDTSLNNSHREVPVDVHMPVEIGSHNAVHLDNFTRSLTNNGINRSTIVNNANYNQLARSTHDLPQHMLTAPYKTDHPKHLNSDPKQNCQYPNSSHMKGYAISQDRSNRSSMQLYQCPPMPRHNMLSYHSMTQSKVVPNMTSNSQLYPPGHASQYIHPSNCYTSNNWQSPPQAFRAPNGLWVTSSPPTENIYHNQAYRANAHLFPMMHNQPPQPTPFLPTMSSQNNLIHQIPNSHSHPANIGHHPPHPNQQPAQIYYYDF